jgi:hypothetical protein
MKYLSLTLIILCLCVATATAQFSTLEFYGGVGVFSNPEERFTEVLTGPQFVGRGEGFFLQQQGTQTTFTSTEYEAGQSVQVGAEGHYAVGKHGSLYAGVRVQAAVFNYRSGNTSFETVTAGPIDTVFFEPGNVGGGGLVDFCPGTSFLDFENDEPDRAFTLDVGIPIGYRHRFFNDRISLRVQGSVNVPILNRHTTQNPVIRQEGNCLRFEQVSADASPAYRLNAFVFRAGGGVDFSIGHSFSLGVMVEQQLNATFKTSSSFIVDEGNFLDVPEVSDFRPLNISLVGRFVIR